MPRGKGSSGDLLTHLQGGRAMARPATRHTPFVRPDSRQWAPHWQTLPMLVGQRHFHGASTSERVPLLAVANDRTTPENASTTASSAVLRTHRGTAWSCGKRERMETWLQLLAVAHVSCERGITKWRCPTSVPSIFN